MIERWVQSLDHLTGECNAIKAALGIPGHQIFAPTSYGYVYEVDLYTMITMIYKYTNIEQKNTCADCVAYFLVQYVKASRYAKRVLLFNVSVGHQLTSRWIDGLPPLCSDLWKKNSTNEALILSQLDLNLVSTGSFWTPKNGCQLVDIATCLGFWC